MQARPVRPRYLSPDATMYNVDDTALSPEIKRMANSFPIIDLWHVRNLGHAQTREFLDWNFHSNTRLTDLGVYLALKVLPADQRGQRHPLDFNPDGTIRLSRRPCGGPVIVQAYGLLWIVV